MTASGASDRKQVQRKGPLQEAESPLQKEEASAWEPIEGNLWIPHRIRGSWRGGVLG